MTRVTQHHAHGSQTFLVKGHRVQVDQFGVVTFREDSTNRLIRLNGVWVITTDGDDDVICPSVDDNGS